MRFPLSGQMDWSQLWMVVLQRTSSSSSPFSPTATRPHPIIATPTPSAPLTLPIPQTPPPIPLPIPKPPTPTSRRSSPGCPGSCLIPTIARWTGRVQARMIDRDADRALASSSCDDRLGYGTVVSLNRCALRQSSLVPNTLLNSRSSPSSPDASSGGRPSSMPHHPARHILSSPQPSHLSCRTIEHTTRIHCDPDCGTGIGGRSWEGWRV